MARGVGEKSLAGTIVLNRPYLAALYTPPVPFRVDGREKWTGRDSRPCLGADERAGTIVPKRPYLAVLHTLFGDDDDLHYVSP